ncbi:type II toxin-antitoxin system RelE/ParE family toxin [Parabacteroides sp. BX2]|jgi:plasmid stabilization system protein ParE|uniref:Type II toxin-antitoxin system RelE/ParE family toxin n=1 Tax=Parabacteroides segnis TaxID=2763058 RepID=A0ABR7E2M2_9BACT|nr:MULTISPECIES: type II toxin-antitoxin system RelE/ParE family toxin [Parabacteroides]MBC5643997.1 type II toxin-antitoxin system RelE/ParE family toxin [Parabacteroides segnis]MCM0714300.1 type II toxin-antitoxin system RelE/ParE family toxin [Parabacteroides sp. TA-V-105]
MQNYKVVFSDLAIADLNDIVQYITENESYTCAKHVERELLRTAKSLTTFPNGYAKDEYASTPDLTVRFITKWNYKLDYTVQDDIVIIAAIFHCSRNPIRLKDRF